MNKYILVIADYDEQDGGLWVSNSMFENLELAKDSMRKSLEESQNYYPDAEVNINSEEKWCSLVDGQEGKDKIWKIIEVPAAQRYIKINKVREKE